ncbi:MAG TPA: outer membrane beta-barrel protein [Hymenobacter sp.]
MTAQGDTLRGVLDVPRLVSDQGLQFRPDKQAAAKTLTIKDLKAFGLEDGRRFVKRTITTGRNSQTGGIDSAVVFVQQQIAGTVNFYRYEHSPLNNRTQAGSSANEPVQYFIDSGSRSLIRLSSRTYQSTFSVLFKDCQTVVEEVARTAFREKSLGDLVLRYNTQCPNSTTVAHDYRVAEKPSTTHLLFSGRGSVQSGNLWYTSSPDLARKDSRMPTGAAFGVEVRLANDGPWSLSSGLHYAQLHRETNRTRNGFAGTVNANESIVVPASVQVQSVQVPLLVRYTLGHSMLRPYLAAGVLYGQYLNNKTMLPYLKITNEGGTNSSYRTDVVVEHTNKLDNAHFTIASVVRLGLQIKTSARFSPLLEIQYSAGRDSDLNSGFSGTDLGDLHYQTLGFTAGLEF